MEAERPSSEFDAYLRGLQCGEGLGPLSAVSEFLQSLLFLVSSSDREQLTDGPHTGTTTKATSCVQHETAPRCSETGTSNIEAHTNTIIAKPPTIPAMTTTESS